MRRFATEAGSRMVVGTVLSFVFDSSISSKSKDTGTFRATVLWRKSDLHFLAYLPVVANNTFIHYKSYPIFVLLTVFVFRVH